MPKIVCCILLLGTILLLTLLLTLDSDALEVKTTTKEVSITTIQLKYSDPLEIIRILSGSNNNANTVSSYNSNGNNNIVRR